MNQQIEINFETKSPINIDKLNGQNKIVWSIIQRGEKVSCFHNEVFGKMVFHSRIADIRKVLKEHGIKLQSCFKEFNFNGIITHAKEYWI